MKNRVLILISFVVGISFLKAQNVNKDVKISTNYFSQASIIDSLDTIVIDISQASIFLSSMRIPVSVLSDDPIYSLDINFKYNQLNLQYDSICNLTNYIQAFSFFNAVDSTVRFTSNSMNIYTNDTPLVLISFTMLALNISAADFNSVNGYLNGDPCIVKLINPLGMSINESLKEDNDVSIYPCPANGKLHIRAKENSEIRILNLNGCDVIPPFNYSNSESSINTEGIQNGIYIVKISNNSYSLKRRIVLEK